MGQIWAGNACFDQLNMVDRVNYHKWPPFVEIVKGMQVSNWNVAVSQSGSMGNIAKHDLL